MRIKKAVKLLRRESECRTAPPPPVPWDSASAMIAAAGILCELNRSLCVDDSISYPREDLEITNEEEVGDVVGIGFQAKEKEMKVQKGQARRRRVKETEMADEMKCKKTDGKSWHCNRASQLPHSLCSYHLTQLRSYRTNDESSESNNESEISPHDRSEALDDIDEEGGFGRRCNVNYKKMMPQKKRGRKPVKARSLKSLL